MSKKFWRLSLILLAIFLLASGCTFPWQKKNAPTANDQNSGSANVGSTQESATSTNAVKKFANYAELQKFLAENNNPSGGYAISPLLRGDLESDFAAGSMALTNSVAAPTAGAVSSNQGSSGPNNSLDYSATNNQVAGVDEADIIKTDGTYIYALVHNDLFIIKAVPGSAAQTVSKITFVDRPQDIFIDGASLAVFGFDNQIYAQPLYKSFRRQNSYTFFKVFDLSDPTKPKQVRDLKFEGNYADARLIGDYAYLITNTYNNYLMSEPLVPRVIDNGEVLSQDCSSGSHCFAPDVYYFDQPYDSYTYTNITAINLKDSGEAVSGQAYLMTNGQNLYVSNSNIYLTYTQYLNQYDLEQDVKRQIVFSLLSSDDQSKVKQIEATPSFILNKNEKRAKVTQLLDQYIATLSTDAATALSVKISDALGQALTAKAAEMETTVIHKISIEGGKIEYKAMGQVPGQVLNQFSMDEKGDNFRLATTRNAAVNAVSGQASDSYNNVYILDANLQLAGKLENLATTERIYAARFMGDRLYLVTFKQTDPLYVINLSDPAKPAVLGAIKVPGFSNYLQAADTTGAKLIGFGRDADVASDGSVTVKGLKLSLYDFTDLAKPRELDSYFLGDASSNSIALSDHKAFLYSVSKKLLVIPAVLYAGGQINFAGALAFTLDNDHFTLKGRVDHSAGGASEPDYWNGYDYYDNTVKRSLYINDALYTFSNKFLKINNLTDLSEIKTVSLLPSDYSVTSGAGSPSAGSSGAGVSTPGSSSVGSGPLGGASPLPAAGAGLNGLVSSPDAGSTPASAPPIVNPPANQSTSTNGTSTGPTPPSP